MRKSIRWRLQLWYGALLVVVLSGFDFTAFQLEKARQFRRIDEGLHERLSVLADALRAMPERGARERKSAFDLRLTPEQAALFQGRSEYYFVVWMQSPHAVAESPGAPRAVPKPENGEAVVRMRGDWRETYLFAAPVDCLLVGRSIASEQEELRTLAAVLSAIGGAVLALGLIGGWWLATQAIRPVQEISATAARIAAGDLSQRIAAAETQSELGQLAAVLNSTFARLDAAFAQQGRFTADAAHELRTPVSVMLTQTQAALARDRSAADYRQTIETCERATQRMRRLIESLLELARLDAGQELLHRENCDLAQIVAACLEQVRPLADARGLRLYPELSPAPCRGDAERLAQVATNLLCNAIDYNHDGGEIRIHTRLHQGEVSLTVSNTGPGIAAADLPHIFERFQRGDKSRSGQAGHSGLGLAIAQAIVQSHGGSISVVSEPGMTTFTVKMVAGK